MSNTYFTDPKTFNVLPSEDYPIGIDMTSVLGGGTITGVSSTFYDLNTNKTVTISNPSWTGAVVAQQLNGSDLVANHSYRLTVTCTTSVAGLTVSEQLIVNVGAAP